MTHKFSTYERATLYEAVKRKGFCTFSLGTADISELGLTQKDDIKKIRAGGRFDLTAWRKWMPPQQSLMAAPAPMTPMHILHDASQIASHLYIELDVSAGLNGAGDITATYNAEPNAATSRNVMVNLSS